MLPPLLTQPMSSTALVTGWARLVSVCGALLVAAFLLAANMVKRHHDPIAMGLLRPTCYWGWPFEACTCEQWDIWGIACEYTWNPWALTADIVIGVVIVLAAMATCRLLVGDVSRGAIW